MNAPPVILIIIVTYNRWLDTRDCLVSLFAADGPVCRVIVLDNGSTDETLAALPREFPDVELIRNPSNLGYAEGNNAGLRLALAQGAEFVVVLNNDVIVAPDWLGELTAAARVDSQAALIGPLVLHADAPDVIQSAGGMLPRDWHAFHRGANEPDTHQFSRTEHVDWLTGCAVLVRCNALERIGLLDSGFFMYGEDVDWGVRAQRAGYHVLFTPKARVWHKGVRSDYAPAPYVTYYTARNELQLIRKHHGGAVPVIRAFARNLRTLTSWTLRPKWQEQRAHRNALARALRDFLRGASGQTAGPV